MKSLKWKFVIMYVAVVFIAMIASGTFIFVNFWMTGQENAYRETRNAHSEVVRHALNETTDYNELRLLLDNHPILNQLGIEYNIISGSIPISTIATTTMSSDDHMNFPEYISSTVTSALNGNADFRFGRSLPTVDGYERRYAEFAAPFFKQDPYTGESTDIVQFVVYIRKDVDYLFDNISQIMLTIAISLFFALAATVVVGILFAGSLTKPLAELTKKTKEFCR